MSPKKPAPKPAPKHQPGYDIVTVTGVELVGVGLLAVLAGTSDQMGKLLVVLMWGFLLGWLLTNSDQLTGWMKRL